jgi:hypothetical protein
MRLRLFLTALGLLAAAAVDAEGFETFNQSNLARFAALPSLGQGAVLPAGQSRLGVTLDWTNEFYARSAGEETLRVDGETQRYALRYRAGGPLLAGRATEWSVELPLLTTGGGLMDAAIEGWHDTFGLPNSNRAEFPQDEYRVQYVRDGVTTIDLAEGHRGLGDVRLGVGLALAERWTLRGLLQLPTGDVDHLTGGHFGGALWADYSLPLSESRRAALVLSGGVAAMATGGPLAAQQQPVAGVAGAVLILPLYGALDGVVQLNAHTRLYQDSKLDTLARPGAPLAFGLRWPFRQWQFDLAVVEDASVNASPDFGLILGVQLRRF